MTSLPSSSWTSTSALTFLRLELSRDEFFRLGVNPADAEGFNMTAFALRSSAYRNAVSKKHGEVTRKMWQHLWPELSEDKVPIDTSPTAFTFHPGSTAGWGM